MNKAKYKPPFPGAFDEGEPTFLDTYRPDGSLRFKWWVYAIAFGVLPALMAFFLIK